MLRPESFDVDGIELFRYDEDSLSLVYNEGQLRVRESSYEKGIGIRVLQNRRLGFSSCQDEASIPMAVKDAKSFSKYSPQSGFSFPEPKKYQSFAMDKRLEYFSEEDALQLLEQVLDGAALQGSIPQVHLSYSKSKTEVENSNGLKAPYPSPLISIYCESMIEDGSGFSYHSGLSIPEDPAALGEKASSLAKDMLSPKKPPPGNYDVVLEHDAFDSIIDILLPSISGDWKRKGISVLSEKLGKKVFSEQFTIHDNGIAEAASRRPFDDEGVSSERKCLVKKGVLEQFIFDRENAALAGAAGEGFCSRSHYSEPPGIGVSNLEIEPGDFSNLDEELGEHITVHSLHGVHTANTTTGDFGLEVNIAFLHKNKEKIPVRGFLLSGNIFELFRNMKGLEKKTEVHNALIAPRIAFSSVRVVS